jgi:hypothetical protein
MRVFALDIPGGRAGPDLRIIAELAPPAADVSIVRPGTVHSLAHLAEALPGGDAGLTLVAACWLAPIALAAGRMIRGQANVVLIDPGTVDHVDIVGEVNTICEGVGLAPTPSIVASCGDLESFDRVVPQFRGDLARAIAREAGGVPQSGGADLARRYVEWVRALLMARMARTVLDRMDGVGVTVIARSGRALPGWIPADAYATRVAGIDDRDMLGAAPSRAAIRHALRTSSRRG